MSKDMSSILPFSVEKSDGSVSGSGSGSGSGSARKGEESKDLMDAISEFIRHPGITEKMTQRSFYDSYGNAKQVNPKILTYNPTEVRSLLAPFLNRELTVCNSLSLWLHHLLMVGYALFLMLVLANSAFPDGHMGNGSACGEGNGPNINMCQLDATLEDAKGEYRFLVAFILAGFVNLSVGRWMTRRTNYASLCGNCRNLIINVASYTPLEEAASRQTLGRWIILAFELAVLKARGHMDSAEGRAYLAEAGLVLEGEWESMVGGDRHSAVFWWIQMMAIDLEKKGIINAIGSQRISESVSSMRAQANDLMSSLDRDKPFPYVVLCGMLVKVNVFIMSTWKGVQWALWLYAAGGPVLVKQPKFWVDIVVLLSWNVAYMGLYDLGYMLENPFQNRRIDVAHEVIGEGLRRLSVELMKGGIHLPPALSHCTRGPEPEEGWEGKEGK